MSAKAYLIASSELLSVVAKQSTLKTVRVGDHALLLRFGIIVAVWRILDTRPICYEITGFWVPLLPHAYIVA